MANRANRTTALMLCLLLSRQAPAETGKAAAASTPAERAAGLIRYHDWLVKKHERAEYLGANNKPISKDAFMRAALVEQRSYEIGSMHSTAASSVARFPLRPDAKMPAGPTVIPPATGDTWKPSREELAKWHEGIAQRCALIEYFDGHGKAMAKEAFLTALTRGQPGVKLTQRGDPACGRMQLSLFGTNDLATTAQPSKK